AEIVLYGVGLVSGRDDDIGEAVAAQQVEHMLHERPVGHRDHRLGLVVSERPEARAFTTGHDHGPHRRTTAFTRGPARKGSWPPSGRGGPPPTPCGPLVRTGRWPARPGP